jgi:hypothetical protein
MPRDLAISCDSIDCNYLLSAWTWLVPAHHTPLMVGAFGDWIFGAPDGSHWTLCLLEGDYRQIARDSAEFNRLKRQPENLDSWFKAGWVAIAARHGLFPKIDECLGWKVPPFLGGAFSVDNIDVFSLRLYQHIQGQLHQQRHEGKLAK